jgi:hypothetical protein
MQCHAAMDIFVAKSSCGFEVNFPQAFGDNPKLVCNVISTLPDFTENTGQKAITQSPPVMEVS